MEDVEYRLKELADLRKRRDNADSQRGLTEEALQHARKLEEALEYMRDSERADCNIPYFAFNDRIDYLIEALKKHLEIAEREADEFNREVLCQESLE